MAHAWFDLTAGVAGDMVLGSLIDAGAALDEVQQVVDALVPGSVRLEVEPVVRGGQRATKLRVRLLAVEPPHRDWASIRAMLEAAAIPEQTKAWALDAFGLLAAAEARVHGVAPDDVHFHEVGALDSIADVVGACEALRLLGVTSVSASPIALGAGRVRAAHGDVPVPVPAVAELAVGWRVMGMPSQGPGRDRRPAGQSASDREHHRGHGRHDLPAAVTTPNEVGELATPTGLALVRALATACEAMPPLTLSAVGVGAGSKDFTSHPNVVRVVLGDPAATGVVLGDPAAAAEPTGPGRVPPGDTPTEIVELMANVDDLDPRLWPGVLDALLAAGALDAWLVSIQMKKGRPGFTVHALTPRPVGEAVATVMLEQTTTLGVRMLELRRTVLDRTWTDVEVAGQPLAVKIGSRDGRVLHAAAEFDALAVVAAEKGRSQADIAQLAQAAIVRAGLVAGSDAPADARPTS